jgi:hypothetical protein
MKTILEAQGLLYKDHGGTFKHAQMFVRCHPSMPAPSSLIVQNWQRRGKSAMQHVLLVHRDHTLGQMMGPRGVLEDIRTNTPFVFHHFALMK